jgi:hypothetical protein
VIGGVIALAVTLLAWALEWAFDVEDTQRR